MAGWIMRIACLGAVLMVAACGSDSKNSGPDVKGGDAVSNPADLVRSDGTPDTAPQAPKIECTSDEECFAENHICNCFGKCVPAGFKECEADKNCGGKAYCDPCVNMCYDKGVLCDPCNSENYCNPLTGECMPVGNQCEVEGTHCLDYVSGGSYCGRSCLSNAGCPPGYTCQDLIAFGMDYMQCVPDSGRCDTLGNCEEDFDCEFGFICNPQHQCVKGCEEDNECPNDMVCSGFRCSEACDPVNNPCPEGQECNEGRCMIPGGCIDAYDCPVPETFCNPLTNMCEDGCLQDVDCKQAVKECDNGTCVDKACTANYWCSFGLVCDLEAGDCVEPPEPFCEPGCEEDAECGPEGSMCLELQDEDGNSQGKFCFPTCYTDPDNLCPQGYQCTEVTDQDGAVQGTVCARTCYKDPVGFY
jgi:hypothetical protein